MEDYKKIPVNETLEYLMKRHQINMEINANKVSIDREVFKKNSLEKEALKKAKKEYLLNVNTQKYSDRLSETIQKIVKDPIICGNLILIVKNK
jgi:hypothetical protein